jgi:hypothetical protein
MLDAVSFFSSFIFEFSFKQKPVGSPQIMTQFYYYYFYHDFLTICSRIPNPTLFFLFVYHWLNTSPSINPSLVIESI